MGEEMNGSNEVHPLVERSIEEANRNNGGGYPSGRELSGIMAVSRDSDGDFRGPIFFPDEIARFHENALGIEGFEEATVVYGTSFCRADSKEVLQCLAHLLMLQELGVPSEKQKIVYFIDPFSHTTSEFINILCRDYGLNRDIVKSVFINPLGLESRDLDESHLPVAFHSAPSVESIRSLNLPNQVKEIWLEALEESPKSLGDWRIAVDRISTKKLFSRFGLDADLIEVVSFEKVLDIGNSRFEYGISLRDLASEVLFAHKHYAKKVAQYSGRNGEAVSENAPAILSVVGCFGEKFLVDANLEIHVIVNGTRFKLSEFERFGQGLDDDTVLFIKGVIESDENFNVSDLVRRGGVQLSGYGYYQFLGMAFGHQQERNVNSPVASVILDDYENPDGPIAATCHTARKGFVPVSSVKPLVGFNGNYGEAPDLANASNTF